MCCGLVVPTVRTTTRVSGGVFCLGALGVRTVAEVQSPLAAPMFPCARSFNVRIATGGILVGHGLV